MEAQQIDLIALETQDRQPEKPSLLKMLIIETTLRTVGQWRGSLVWLPVGMRAAECRLLPSNLFSSELPCHLQLHCTRTNASLQAILFVPIHRRPHWPIDQMTTWPTTLEIALQTYSNAQARGVPMLPLDHLAPEIFLQHFQPASRNTLRR